MFQPAVINSLLPRTTYNGKAPPAICFTVEANVFQALTLEFHLGILNFSGCFVDLEDQ